MAPIQKKAKKPSSSTYPSDTSAFSNNKKDKRTIRHSSFIQKIEKSSTKSTKRRRPSKKLITTLESLADALPDIQDAKNDTVVAGGQARVRAKSMKTRPGAMKRKEKLEKGERDEFGKNMAVLMAQPNASAEAGAGAGTQRTANRWEALRQAIGSYEKKEEFQKG